MPQFPSAYLLICSSHFLPRPLLLFQAETKLRQLTIVALASEKKHIDYDSLLKELHIADVRQLEDLIIDVIYADIIRGKIDQKNKQVGSL